MFMAYFSEKNTTLISYNLCEAEIAKGINYASQLKFGAHHAVILAEEEPQVLY